MPLERSILDNDAPIHPIVYEGPTSTSKNSSRLITFAFAASSAAFFWDLRTKPGGKACLY